MQKVVVADQRRLGVAIIVGASAALVPLNWIATLASSGPQYVRPDALAFALSVLSGSIVGLVGLFVGRWVRVPIPLVVAALSLYLITILVGPFLNHESGQLVSIVSNFVLQISTVAFLIGVGTQVRHRWWG
jgi:hypothetical protein